MTCEAIIFDLDGTLWDASAASAAGWNAGLRKAGFEHYAVSACDIKRVSGKPFEYCVSEIFPEEEVQQNSALVNAINAGERESLEARGGKIYPGVLASIERLAESFELYLVSNCQDWYLDCFWKVSNLQSHFKYWDCHGISRKPKSEMIENLVSRLGLTSSIYIGDTRGDQAAAKAAGVAFGFVEYGFGSVSEADQRFASFESVVSCFEESKSQKGQD